MSLWDAPVRDVRPVATDERRRLLAFLAGLTAAEWIAPTAAPGWTVKDLALHLLDDDLTWLSGQRDGDISGFVTMTDRDRFVELLAAKNQRFVDGARSLSRPVTVDLLAWAGEQIDTYHATCDLRRESWVSWASDKPVPFWFNLAQEFTERWVHQQQMREAVGRVEDHDDLLPEVLGTFVWALPYQMPAPADDTTVIAVAIDGVATWTLTRGGTDGWTLTEGEAEHPTATVQLSPEAAWRSFVGADVSTDQVYFAGARELTDAVMRVRAIIV